jgi:hypothetical protein
MHMQQKVSRKGGAAVCSSILVLRHFGFKTKTQIRTSQGQDIADMVIKVIDLNMSGRVMPNIVLIVEHEDAMC